MTLGRCLALPLCDLELVLAVDISRSMDLDEQRLQRDGYVAALRHPEVVAAIGSGPAGRIAVTYVEWAGPFHQAVLVPWTVVSSRAEAEAFSDRVAAAPMVRERGTSISEGLAFAASLFPATGARGARRAIDVSGDGPNNMGPAVVPVRDRVVSEGITINGLPIMLKPAFSYGPYNIPDLDLYYEDCVIGGPGAFMISVDDMSRFAVAVRRKLVLEIAGRMPEPRVLRAAVFEAPPRVDCLIGEKQRSRWLYEDPSLK
ncbi:MAG: DUF1194 domain-containing protein [Rhizobiales bacterium]|nr:DUF1194 domain-containing protein [Hyphomicrobiales bacterium]